MGSFEFSFTMLTPFSFVESAAELDGGLSPFNTGYYFSQVQNAVPGFRTRMPRGLREISLWLGFHAQTELVEQERPHIRTLFDLFIKARVNPVPCV